MENVKKVEVLSNAARDVIELDIGGTHKIATTRSTLTRCPNSALAVMFSGRHQTQLHNGRVFLDRDGEAFTAVISFLRTGKIPIFKTKIQESEFMEEVEFWQIQLEANVGENDANLPLEFDAQWCADTLALENSNTVVRKNGTHHGIVFGKIPLDNSNPYIEFKITINIPSRTKSHLFVGLVDKSKYRYEHLTSTFWKDSPSSYYWDVWNTKLIKTDEGGIQTGVMSGYGCACEDYETKLGIKYDAKNRSVSFFKNGINQGVAFRQVTSGYYPSLDIWFESGSIEILNEKAPKQKEFL